MALFPKPCCSNSRIDSIFQNSMLHFPTWMLWFLTAFSTCIGGFSLKLGSNATHLSKNATMFAKGCGIHGGMVLLYAKSFYKWSLHVWLPLLFIENILHKLVPVLNAHFFKCYLFFKQCHTFCKGFSHWGMVFFRQYHFTSAVCKFIFHSLFTENILHKLVPA